ncbi:MAG TPA: DUF4012 domain-containing protein [Acidimicrobiales bacterium]
MRRALAVICIVAVVLAAFGDARPVGVRWLDAIWSAGFAVALVLAASRARRMPTTWMAGIAGVVAVGGDPAGVVFGVLSLAGAAAVAFTRSRERILGAVVGLVAGQALLRGTTYGAAGVPTLVAAIAVVPVIVSAWRIARRRERRLALFALAGVSAVTILGIATAAVVAYQARPHLEAAADGAEDALALLREGDTTAAADAFTRANHEFEVASSSLDGPLGVVGRAVPVVAQHVDALRRVSLAGEDLTATAASAAATADWGELTAANGTVDLDRIRMMQVPVADSSAAIASTLDTVTEVRSPWLLSPVVEQLDRLEIELADTAEQASLAAEGLQVAPALFGGEGPRRYLVAFATPGETRNAGGFAGAFAVVEADGGSLSVGRTGSTMRDLPLDPEAAGLDLPAEWQTRYGGYDLARFPGNLTAGPDWPTDAEVAAQVYAQAPGGGPVDGVIYADPAALVALLRITGPVDVPGVPETLTADNAEQYLLIDQYVQYADAGETRRDVLQDVAQSVFDALVERPLPGLRTLGEVLGPAVAGGHLRIASLADPAESAFLDRAGLSGAWYAEPGADLVSVRSANRGLNKIDVWLHRQVDIETSYDPGSGEVSSTVTVVLRNDAPSSGYPDYLIGNSFDLPDGTNRQLLTLYSPLDLVSVEVDGAASGVQNQTELGLHTYGVPVDIPSGEDRTLTFRLSGAIDPGPTYRLTVLPQPLANPDELRIAVTVAGNPDASGIQYEGTIIEPLHLTVPQVLQAGPG